MPDGPVLEGACSSNHATSWSVAAWAANEIEIASLVLDVSDAGYPEIASIPGQIAHGLLHERRDDTQVVDQTLLLIGGQRKVIGPELDHRVVRRPLVTSLFAVHTD